MSKSIGLLCLLGFSVALSACGSTSHPAATVNGQDISMAVYSRQVTYKCALTSANFQGTDICKGKDPTGLRQKLRRTVLNNLIDETLVRQYAQKHHITIPADEFNQQWQNEYDTQFHRNYSVLKARAKAVGLSVADVKNMVYFDMLQQRVMYDVTKNMPVTTAATKVGQLVVTSTQQAQQARALLQRGASFLSVTQTIDKSQDARTTCSQVGCGELGWLPDAFLRGPRHQVATVPPHTLVGPFPVQGAYLYIYAEQHLTNYPLNAKQQYAMRQQVVFPRWLAQQAQHADVHRYAAT